MENATIITLLSNSGLKVFGIDREFVYIQDPSCILPTFDFILDYAWVAILFCTAIMLFGWAILYIKNGVKIDSIFNNAKSIIVIFCILGAVKPIVNFIYGDNLFAQKCDTKKIYLTNIYELLEQRNKKFSQSDDFFLNENFNVVDTGIKSVSDSYNVTVANTEHNQNNTTITSSFIGVENAGKDTIYIKKNGDKIKRSDGTVAWRNNNPGNIIKSKFAMENGAIGDSGRWAVFPDEQTGLNAIVKLLKTSGYINLSVGQAIHKWAPVSDGNNPDAYANSVSEMTGLSISAVIKNLKDSDLMKIARAIQNIEGWQPGKEEKI